MSREQEKLPGEGALKEKDGKETAAGKQAAEKKETGTRFLREADASDCRRLFEWRNDPEVRKNSFHKEEIPWESHQRWFAGLMADQNRRQYILMAEDAEGQVRPAGQIRIDIDEGGEAEISYSIAASFRGTGCGSAAVRLLEEKVESACPGVSVLAAKVLPENTASRRIFEKNGFVQTARTEGYVEYQKRLPG